MIRVPFEHLIGSGNRIDVPRSCAFVIQAITLVWRVTTRAVSSRTPLLARLFTLAPMGSQARTQPACRAADFSIAANSAVAMWFQGHQPSYGFPVHSTARTDHVETAALRQAQGRLSAVQAWAKPRVPTAAAVPASPACDTNARWNRLLQPRLVITSSAPSAAGAWSPCW